MNTNTTRRSITAAALALFVAATLSACSLGSGVPADQVVPSYNASASGAGGSLATPTASPAPIEDKTDLATGVIDGFAAWGIDRSAVDMSTASAVFGDEVTENAVSTALFDLFLGYNGDTLALAHEEGLEDVAFADMSSRMTADLLAVAGTPEGRESGAGQVLVPTAAVDGTFVAQDGVTYDTASWTCAMDTVPTTAISANAEIEVRSIFACEIGTTQGAAFVYNVDVTLRMVPAGDTALINSLAYDMAMEAK